MMTHTLKTDPEMFDAVASGHKTYELRFEDRRYKEGDILVLLRTKWSAQQMEAGMPLEYTGHALMRRITHIVRGPLYGLHDGWVILSTSPVSE